MFIVLDDNGTVETKMYNKNLIIYESYYTIKNLDINNVKIIMSNLFENSNYKDVLDGYEKIYDDNGKTPTTARYGADSDFIFLRCSIRCSTSISVGCKTIYRTLFATRYVATLSSMEIGRAHV